MLLLSSNVVDMFMSSNVVGMFMSFDPHQRTKDFNIPPISGRSLLSYPSRRLFKIIVTSPSGTFGVKTHVLLEA